MGRTQCRIERKPTLLSGHYESGHYENGQDGREDLTKDGVKTSSSIWVLRGHE